MKPGEGGSLCPLLAESGPYFHPIFDDQNVRFWEKGTFSLKLRKNERRTAAMRSKADIKLELAKEAANDPERPLAIDDIIRLQQQANCSLLNYA